jgi:hypothetical protein
MQLMRRLLLYAQVRRKLQQRKPRLMHIVQRNKSLLTVLLLLNTLLLPNKLL